MTGPVDRQRIRNQCDDTVEFWRSRLLPEWAVVIDWDNPSPPDVHARVWLPDDYHRAAIHVGFDWYFSHDTTDDEREQTILHELLHMVFRELRWAATKIEENDTVMAAYEHAEEGVVDRLAWQLVGLRYGQEIPMSAGLVTADQQPGEMIEHGPPRD